MDCRCPVTNKSFETCQDCKAIGKDGKCPYMRLDEWSQETLSVMRKLAEDNLEEGRS
jgi:hypothetical protein